MLFGLTRPIKIALLLALGLLWLSNAMSVGAASTLSGAAVLLSDLRPNKWEIMVEQNKTIKQYLMNNSALYGLYRTAKGMIRARNAMLVHSTPGGPSQ